MLPLEVSTKAEEINYIKYRETITKSNKKSTKEIKLDFTKDPQKSIDSLSGNNLSNSLYNKG